MARRRGPRFLVVDQVRFLWSVAHAHLREQDDQGTPRYVDCREVVRIRRDGARGWLEIVFRVHPDRLVSDALLHAGAVLRTGAGLLNLNEPGVARALFDEAVARGWQVPIASQVEIDGWTLFDSALARRSGAVDA
ncbi:MAG: hypothetical protein ACRDPW_04620 [Mycobacteriales bacterium]